MTLSRWLRDYLYIPLGGNRGSRLFTFRNLFLTMLIGGLWHGANWTFVVWGALHGLYLSAERWLRARFKGFTPGRATVLGFALLTFLLINVTWVFFRAKTFAGAGAVLTGMAGMSAKPDPLIAAGPMIIAMVIVSGIFGTHLAMRNTTLEAVMERTPSIALASLWTLLLFAVIIEQGEGSAFIYFAF
jgi:alginate O-acetyltransferase complex protein AlgI